MKSISAQYQRCSDLNSLHFLCNPKAFLILREAVRTHLSTRVLCDDRQNHAKGERQSVFIISKPSLDLLYSGNSAHMQMPSFPSITCQSFFHNLPYCIFKKKKFFVCNSLNIRARTLQFPLPQICHI